MRKLFYEIWERFAYLKMLRTEYIRILYRHHRYRIAKEGINKVLLKGLLWLIGICLTFLGISYGYHQSWTGFSQLSNQSGDSTPYRTLWDWMNLLLIPILLGILTYVLTNAQKSREIAIALLNKREQAIQQYFDYMTNMLVDKNRLNKKQQENASRLIRARTIALFEMVDGKQKGHILRFLLEAQLIKKEKPFLNLRGANLQNIVLEPGSYDEIDLSVTNLDGAIFYRCRFSNSKMNSITMEKADLEYANIISCEMDYANLDKADLYRATLRNTHMTKLSCQNADLQYADLRDVIIRNGKMRGTNMGDADLTKAYLQSSDLSFTNLTNANLTNADFTRANLYGANLRNAVLDGADFTDAIINRRQLRKVKSSIDTKLPTSAKK